jgi:hypothetical protein
MARTKNTRFVLYPMGLFLETNDGLELHRWAGDVKKANAQVITNKRLQEAVQKLSIH